MNDIAALRVICAIGLVLSLSAGRIINVHIAVCVGCLAIIVIFEIVLFFDEIVYVLSEEQCISRVGTMYAISGMARTSEDSLSETIVAHIIISSIVRHFCG